MFKQTSPILKERLNFNFILASPRLKERKEVMSNLFLNAKVLANAEEDGCGDTLGYIYEFPDGEVAIVSDQFSNTISYDSYNNASDIDVETLFTELASNAKVFSGVKEAFLYLRKSKQDNATYFEMRNLVDPLIKNLYKNRVINLREILGEV